LSVSCEKTDANTTRILEVGSLGAFALLACLLSAVLGWRCHLNTLLAKAINAGDATSAYRIWRQGADGRIRGQDRMTLLMLYCDLDELEPARQLLDQGVDVNEQDIRGWTAMVHAVAWHHPRMVDLLLDNGVSVEARDRAGMTPLLWATARADGEMVRHLLERGADIEARDYRGRDALWYARENVQPEMERLLIKLGKREGTPMPIRSE